MMTRTQTDLLLQELTTCRDMLRWSLSQFNQAGLYYGHGTDNAWDEAVYLILAALHLSPDIHLEAILDGQLLKTERETIVKLVERRVKERIPVAYLVQQAWFAGLPFYVDERVIVPRSPMAELIERHFQPWIKEEEITRILDLCTGSGCLAIASALAIPQAQVDAVDISTDALAVAQINLEKHHLTDQVRLIQSDLFQKLSGQIYDVIISNPPYVGSAEYATLPAEYLHEPEISLKTEGNGLAVVVKILREAGRHLSPQGILIVEVGNSEHALVECFPEVPFIWLEFERGGGGVFLLTADSLERYKSVFLTYTPQR